MRKISVSNPKHRNSSYDNDHEPVKASIDQSERQYLSPQASPQPKPSFTITQTAEKSKHGFFSEFEIVKPPKLQSNYSLQQLVLPAADQTYKDKYTCKISSIIPMMKWLPNYELAWLKPDLLAAITVSILQVPQVLAYAQLAGLPPAWGLYASVVPVFLYAIWSTSTKVAVGPGAPSAIMLASAVNGVMDSLGTTDSTTYQEIAMAFTFCCGIIFIVLGIMRAGFVVVFLSRPVMTGFILSASFIILLSQCRSLMGLDIGRYPIFTENLYGVITNLHTIHWYTTLISFISLIILFIPKFTNKIPKWVPFPLIVMILNIIFSYVLDFESLGVKIVGNEVEAGFPIPTIPTFKYIPLVFSSALIVTIVDYMSNIVLADSFEQKTKDTYQQQLSAYKRSQLENDIEENKKIAKPINLPPVDVDANMEFMAYGIANLIGSMFSSQLISASFSRTALNYETNGQTRIAGLIRVIICVLCLLFLMPFLSPLPKCVLASVVITAIYRLISGGIQELKFLYRVSKPELIEFCVSVIAPLIIGMEMGIFLAIGTSIIVNLLRHTFAKVIFLGRLKTKKNNDISSPQCEYVNCELFKEAKSIKNINIIEMKAELSFSNNLRLIKKIRELLNENKKYIIVSLNLTSFIDTTAIRQIVTLFEDAKESYICLSQCRPKVIELIRKYQKIVDDKFPPNVKTFISTHDAVVYLQKIKKRNNDTDCEDDDEINSASDTDDSDTSLDQLSEIQLDNHIISPPLKPTQEGVKNVISSL